MALPSAIGSLGASTLLERTATGIPRLHRTDAANNLATVYTSVLDAYHDRGPVRLGRARRTAVIAVDGLGFEYAAAHLKPDFLTPLTSEFPTTTMACMLTALTGRHAAEHGYVGVQYLDVDGLRSVNCHSGHVDDPTSDTVPRPTATPDLPTIFTALTGAGISTGVLPNELASVHAGIRDRLFRDCETVWSPLPPSGDPQSLVAAFAEQITAAVEAPGAGLIWAYLDLDTHIHRHGFDRAAQEACEQVDRLARALASGGTAVVLFSDHGLTANRASADVERAWRAASAPDWCRLPGGGAGRVRWLYPHRGRRDGLLALLGDGVGDAVVTTPAALADAGLLAPGSIGQQRLGEIVLVATGPNFPTPDPSARYEHGSMTSEEILVPMAVWYPDR